MKKKNMLLITFTILGLSFVGCQSQTGTTSVSQETTTTKEADSTTKSTTPSSEATTATSRQETEATNAATAQTSDSLTEEKAKEIALKDAGVEEKDTSNLRIKTDLDDGKSVYEVEFYVQEKEYDYKIDSTTGEILKRDYEIDDDLSTQQSTSTATGITQEEAIDIVLKKVPGATKEQVNIKSDTDDGKKTYEGKIYYNQKEYEFELNAEDGTILEWSEDDD